MIGTSLNQYQITATIGAGGMGEVFRARDTRLNRDVAVKVLPKDFAADAERLRRFEQEAKTLAALNHPNVLTIHDAGVHEGAPYLVSELLEGQTLREVLGSTANAVLPVRKATDYALQIAQGLAAAHDKGVIHRDLKPENIFVTKDGRVKILDFGLAKLKDLSPGLWPPSPHPMGRGQGEKSLADADAPTTVQPAADSTEPGKVMGTPSYMAPEQVRGELVDHRADLFAFGCVLYEMLSGKRAFKRETPVETMNAILKDDAPELTETHPNLPPAFERLVRRCLEKQPQRRFQSASDLAFALEALSGSSVLQAAKGAAASSRMKFAAGAVIALAVLVLVVLVIWKPWQSRKPEAARLRDGLRKLEIPLPVISRTNTTGTFDRLVISPDGRKLAYASEGRLWVKWLDRLDSPAMLGTLDVSDIFWSRDSAELGYFDRNTIYRISINRGQPSVVCTTGRYASSGVWTSDGRILFGLQEVAQSAVGIYEVSATCGETKCVVTAPDTWFLPVDVLPDGRGILMLVRQNMFSLEVLTRDNQRKRIFEYSVGEGMLWPVFSSSGHIVFERRARGLWAFPFSLDRLERTGEPFRIAERGRRPSMAIDGALACLPIQPVWESEYQMVWMERSGKVTGNIGEPIKRVETFALSPDDRQLAVTSALSGDRYANRMYIVDAIRGATIPLPGESPYISSLFWLHDSQRVLYTGSSSPLSDNAAVFVRSADGLGGEKELFKGDARDLSRDGKYLLLESRGTNAPKTLSRYILMNDTNKALDLPAEITEAAFDFSLSPDSTMLVCVRADAEQVVAYLVKFPELTNRTVVARGNISTPVWHPNGTELFYVTANPRAMMSVPVKREGTLRVGEPTNLFDVPEASFGSAGRPYHFSVASDGNRFVMKQKLVQSASAQTQTAPTAVLVQNWFEEFREKK